MNINNNITEKIVSLAVAELLKEKGFACICHYYEYKGKREHSYYKNDSFFPDRVYIPTIALAIEWIRENFRIHIWVTGQRTDWKYHIKPDEKLPFSSCLFNSPEEATEAALLYTLQNLIP